MATNTIDVYDSKHMAHGVRCTPLEPDYKKISNSLIYY